MLSRDAALSSAHVLLQELQGQQEQLKEQMDAVKQQMNEQHQRVVQAQQELAAAQQAATEKMQALQQAMRRPGLQAPANAAEARQLLVQIQQQAAEEQQRWVGRGAGMLGHCWHLHMQMTGPVARVQAV
jgi:seryl-tRNA synthetase